MEMRLHRLYRPDGSLMREEVLACGCHKVTDAGRVYTRVLQYSAKGTQGIQTTIGSDWRPVTGTLTRSGYLQVGLHGKTARVNRLVAQAFIPNPDGLPESHHKNGNPADNRLENIRWGTAKTNAIDRDLHGRTARGERNAMSKLRDNDVRRIRTLLDTRTLQSIADEFGVSKKLVLLIKQNKAWKHVKTKGEVYEAV